MSSPLQNNKAPISPGRVEFFCLFVACRYIYMEVAVLSCRFNWVWSCKVLWNNKWPMSLERVERFCWFVRYPLKLQKYAILGWLSANQIVRCLNLKNSKTIWGIKLSFCFHWSYKKYYAILVYDLKIKIFYLT